MRKLRTKLILRFGGLFLTIIIASLLVLSFVSKSMIDTLMADLIDNVLNELSENLSYHEKSIEDNMDNSVKAYIRGYSDYIYSRIEGEYTLYLEALEELKTAEKLNTAENNETILPVDDNVTEIADLVIDSETEDNSTVEMNETLIPTPEMVFEDAFSSIILEAKPGRSGSAYTMDRNGTLVHHYLSPGKSLSGRLHIDKMRSELNGELRYVAEINGKERVAGYTYFEPLDLIIVLQMYIEDLNPLIQKQGSEENAISLQKRVETMKVGQTGTVFVFDFFGKVILGETSVYTQPFESVFLEEIRRGDRKSAVLTEPETEEDYEIYFSPVKGTNYVLALQISREEQTQLSNLTLIIIGIVLLVSIILVSFFVIRIAGHITRPINTMAGNLGDLAEGKGDFTELLNIPTNDEIGQLANRFNSFLRLLNSDMLTVKQSAVRFSLFATDISSSSQKLSESSETQADGMESVLNNVNSFASVLDEMLKEIKELQDYIMQAKISVEEVTQGINETSNAMSEAREQSVESAESVNKGKERMDLTIAETRNMVKSNQQVAGKIHEVVEQTQKIYSILDVIEDISERTNVLATNASIQAAHAGEAGRGFAVVASEIRKLSVSTAKAVRQVNEIITGTLSSIQEAGNISRTGESIAGEMMTHISETGEILNDIVSHFRSIDTMTVNMDVVIKQEMEGMNHLTDTANRMYDFVTDLRSSIDKQNEGYKHIEEIVETATSNAQEYAKTSKVLAQLGTYLKTGGEDLNFIVRKYKLNDKTDPEASSRQAKRRQMLYNLEAFDADSGRYLGYLKDVSETGMMLISQNPVQKGIKIRIKIQLPLNKDAIDDYIICTGEVRWTKPFSHAVSAGIMITELGAEEERKLSTLVRECGILEDVAEHYTEDDIEMLEDVDELEEIDELEELEELE